jgi:hypothetical protein
MTRSEVIMAIYPNAVGFGFAIVKSPREPLECGVVKISPISNKKCLKRIKTYFDYYEPKLVVLQGLSGKGSYKSKRVTKLIQRIVTLASSCNLKVVRYSRAQIRFVFSEFKAKTKYEIARTIVKWLPQFKHQMPTFRKPWMAEDYHMGMFDALSLVVTHFYQS